MADQPQADPDRRASDALPHSSVQVRRGTLVITNVTKVTGLYIAFHEGVLRAHHDPATLALAAFMMAGAQISEGIVLALADRFFGKPPE